MPTLREEKPMPIRFPCPACRQPLEVDDEWGGQTVACPYCRRVVTAPRNSTWPTGEIPIASAVRGTASNEPSAAVPGWAPPPPPAGGTGSAQPSHARHAEKALVLAVIGAGLSVAAFMLWSTAVKNIIDAEVGSSADMAQIMRAYEELVKTGHLPRPPALMVLVAFGALSSLAGVVAGARSLAKSDSRRGLAISACIVGGVFLLCPLFWVLTLANAAALSP